MKPGLRIDSVEVIQRLGTLGDDVQWLLRCDCGRFVVELGSRIEKATRARYRRFCCDAKRGPQGHSRTGLSHTGAYRSWYAAWARCHNPKNPAYPGYGGSGIRMCPEWHPPAKQGFMRFLEHLGHRPEGLSLDRIDPAGHYEPGNVRWATTAVQHRNRRSGVRSVWHKGALEELTHVCLGRFGVWVPVFLVAIERAVQVEQALDLIRSPIPGDISRSFSAIKDVRRHARLVTSEAAAAASTSSGRYRPTWLETQGGPRWIWYSSRPEQEGREIVERMMERDYARAVA